MKRPSARRKNARTKKVRTGDEMIMKEIEGQLPTQQLEEARAATQHGDGVKTGDGDDSSSDGDIYCLVGGDIAKKGDVEHGSAIKTSCSSGIGGDGIKGDGIKGDGDIAKKEVRSMAQTMTEIKTSSIKTNSIKTAKSGTKMGSIKTSSIKESSIKTSGVKLSPWVMTPTLEGGEHTGMGGMASSGGIKDGDDMNKDVTSVACGSSGGRRSASSGAPRVFGMKTYDT